MDRTCWCKRGRKQMKGKTLLLFHSREKSEEVVGIQGKVSAFVDILEYVSAVGRRLELIHLTTSCNGVILYF